MAIKNWSKIGKYKWRFSAGGSSFRPYVVITPGRGRINPKRKVWIVDIENNSVYNEFHTLKQANKYAVSYMGRHPNG